MQLTWVWGIVFSRQLLEISNPNIEVIPPTLSATAQRQCSVNFLINKLCFLCYSNTKWGFNWPWNLTTIKIQSENLEWAWAHRVRLPSDIYLITPPITATTLPLTHMNIQKYRKHTAFGCSPYLTHDLLILRLPMWILLKTTERIWLRSQHTKRKMWGLTFEIQLFCRYKFLQSFDVKYCHRLHVENENLLCTSKNWKASNIRRC